LGSRFWQLDRASGWDFGLESDFGFRHATAPHNTFVRILHSFMQDFFLPEFHLNEPI